MHLNSELLFRKYLQPLFQEDMRVLEIGPDGRNPYVFKSIVNKASITWDLVDMEKTCPEITFVGKDEYSFPVPDNHYDIVFSSSVIEHVRKVWVWLPELARVCKRGGKVLTISPISWPFHGVPFDCWRIYPEGMKALYEEAGLAVECSFYQTLENADVRRGYPGRSQEHGRGALSALKSVVKNLLGWPQSYAVDLVTIGKK